MNINIEKNSHKQASKKFSKTIRVGLTLRLFIKKNSQTRVGRIGNDIVKK